MFNIMFGWIDPWWWYAAASVLTLFGAMGFGPIGAKQDAEAAESIAAGVRRALWASALGLGCFALIGGLVPQAEAARAVWGTWWATMAKSYSLGLVAAYLLGFAGRVLAMRYAVPWWSQMVRSWRVEQNVDTKSDIREEFGRYAPRDYDPSKYFTKDGLFVGLAVDGSPIYLEWPLVRETHMQVVGPTRWGKGVSIGTSMAQCVREGWGVWYIDPKGDAHLPAMLADFAGQHGRRFAVLDLVDGIGAWAPFAGGTAEERASRLVAAFKLEDSGSEADFYKRAERQLVREVMARMNPREASLGRIAKEVAHAKARKFAGSNRAHDTTAVEDGLAEWSAVTNVAVRPNDGLSCANLIRERAVVYVRCRTQGVTREIARILLHELTDTVLREEPGRTGTHVLLAVDESRSMISAPVVSALTTVAGAGMTMVLAYQSLLDVRNLDDKRMDAGSVESSINVNCQVKLLHGAIDTETAEYVSELTGQKRVLVAQLEETEVGQMGGERWGDRRAFRQDQDALVSADTIRALPQRVPVLIRPSKPAQVCFTCWTRYERDAWEAVKVGSIAPPAPEPAIDVRDAPIPKRAAPKA